MLKINRIITIVLITLSLTGVVWSQSVESAANSNLTGVALPANAQRIGAASVPAEISGTLEKIVASADGKLRQGDSEVLAWGGAGYRKANAPNIVGKLRGTLESNGWKYEVGGTADGVTLFRALKDGQKPRAIVGFYAANDDAMLVAWTEILSADATAENSVETDSQPIQNAAAKSGNASLREIVGVWRNGNVSMMQEKNLTTGQITSSNGSTFTYKFFPDGRFEYIGYIKSTMYGCTTDLFNDKRGKVEISGNKITLVPTKNYWKNTYSCSPASNKERDYVLERETYTFRTKTDEYGKTLICLANAKGESCFRREE
ncbi:MAG: hypothetical protein M3209_08470 [Acidobacteriota bacterium]|nr:hypothetical protein [Acidobacteriota bacterium]